MTREPETNAKRKLRQLWQPGDLFPGTDRYPRKPGVPPVDRLAGILRNGIIAPAACEDGSVCSDLYIPEFQRLEIPLYLCDGTVFWPRE